MNLLLFISNIYITIKCYLTLNFPKVFHVNHSHMNMLGKIKYLS